MLWTNQVIAERMHTEACKYVFTCPNEIYRYYRSGICGFDTLGLATGFKE